MKNILIVGSGALGTLFAGRLAEIGASVTVLGTWRNAIDALNRQGAGLVQPDGSVMRFPVQATKDPAECKNIDLAISLVKAWQTGRAAQQLAQCLPENGVVLTLQNGLGNRETLSASLGARRVLLGVTTIGSTLLEPGLARTGSEGDVFLEAHPCSRDISALLQNAGMKVNIVPDSNSLLWGKLVINAAINPITALLRVPNGILLKRPAARQIMAGLAVETAAVATALGVVLPFVDPIAMVEDVARSTAGNSSSMLQDVLRGTTTEIDAICGAVARAGETHGVPVPLNWTMWQLVSALHAG